MLRKLYSLVSGATSADNPDSPQHHEVLLPGFLYGMIIKERFEECLNGVKAQITQDMRQKKDKPFTDRKLCFILAPTSIRYHLAPPAYWRVHSNQKLLSSCFQVPWAANRRSCPPKSSGGEETFLSPKSRRRRRDIHGTLQIPET
jgi:hypothetical protein